MKLESIKEGVGEFFESVLDGWRHLKERASGALTRFRSGEGAGMPARSEVDDLTYFPLQSWSMLGGDVFEDAERLVVRLELPGMEKEEIRVDVLDRMLVVSGEKRFSREQSAGRWRVLQCAYGQFERRVALSAEVDPASARASYRNGVLRVELPKREPGLPEAVTVPVD